MSEGWWKFGKIQIKHSTKSAHARAEIRMRFFNDVIKSEVNTRFWSRGEQLFWLAAHISSLLELYGIEISMGVKLEIYNSCFPCIVNLVEIKLT
jgi:hypothetical protein